MNTINFREMTTNELATFARNASKNLAYYRSQTRLASTARNRAWAQSMCTQICKVLNAIFDEIEYRGV
jgi:hypothetical protein